ncbi:MAG: DUF4091 domain-containing protein [Angelakisella sp.]
MEVQVKLLDSMVKVFADAEPQEREITKVSGFKGEVLSFQLAFAGKGNAVRDDGDLVAVESPVAEQIHLRTVELVPVRFAAHGDADDNYLRKTPGLYPDLLRELRDGTCPTGQVRVYPNQWQSLWADFETTADTPAGVYPVTLRLLDRRSREVRAEATLMLEVYPAVLPEQTLVRTNWFHADCLASYYKTPVFSDRHWELMENFIATAVKRGINLILTPIFTPPLDTAVGGERPTVQLVKVACNDGNYCFGYKRFDRWVELCNRVGVRYFEMSHLFSQWGATAAPKIIGIVDGVEQQLFGWETDAHGEEYTKFLTSFLTSFVAHLRQLGIFERCYFHISDEPSLEQLESYRAAKAVVEPLLGGLPIIDALSSFEFYKSGVLTKPIPANDHIEPFLAAQVKGLWTYYCICQYKDVSNLFISMPGARTRMLGVQLYKYNIEGFLQWGYNFYYSQYSGYELNPYCSTDGDGFAPAGDPFQVYPGANGKPEESLRLMLLNKVMEDLRAFQLLEHLAGRELVLALMEEGLEEPITFSCYPTDHDYLLRLRDKVDGEILKRL